jgi:hypothetical protein
MHQIISFIIHYTLLCSPQGFKHRVSKLFTISLRAFQDKVKDRRVSIISSHFLFEWSVFLFFDLIFLTFIEIYMISVFLDW